MRITDRFNELTEEVEAFLESLGQQEVQEAGRIVNQVAGALQELEEIQESVGEIPRIRHESKLSPVLLKAHSSLDRARLALEERGDQARAGQVWELEQKIYRLLNDL